MDARSLVFSNNRSLRVQHHVLFWLAWLGLSFISSSVGIMHASNIAQALLLDFLVIIQSNWLKIPFCYAVIYYVVPKYFGTSRFAIGTFIIVAMVVAYYVLSYVNLRITSIPIGHIMQRNPMPDAAAKFFAFKEIIQPMGPLGCCAIIGSIRFLKFWYVKQQENVALVRENAVAELQLLKAQVHPHFLFNTLNNIYSFTLNKSPLAAELIEKLSAILRYMIMEGQKNEVPLQEEIDLILDYVDLEKVRYGKRLDITVSVHGVTSHLMIAPLLMIPFIENSFKHGSSQLLHNPMINVTIALTDNELLLEVLNNKPAPQSEPVRVDTKGGLGLKNVKKRLQLLYPRKHSLVINAADTTFSVSMRLALSTSAEPVPPTTESVNIAYANP